MALAAKIIFVVALLLCFSGWISPPVALTAGIIFGLSVRHPYAELSRGAARILLQVSVVALGFGMNLHEVVKAGRSGFIYTALGIVFTLGRGAGAGQDFANQRECFVPDYRGDGHLRRKRDRGDRADIARG